MTSASLKINILFNLTGGTAKTYASKNHFDALIFSEPLATINLIHEYNQLHGSRQNHFCQFHGVHTQRIRVGCPQKDFLDRGHSCLEIVFSKFLTSASILLLAIDINPKQSDCSSG